LLCGPFGLLPFTTHGYAQGSPSTVVASCGAQSIPTSQGTSGTYIDTTGNLCTNASGGSGGGAVFGPTATGSASANPPVQIGGTTTGAAGANVQGAAVKPASTAPSSTDSSLVVAESPNSQQSTTIGTTADAAYAGSGNATIPAALKGIYNAATASIPVGANVIGFTSNDPCSQATKLGAVVNLTASGQAITGTSAKKTYVCSLDITSATAQNIALVEGTGSVCATNIFGLAGGTTAATGWNLAANGGLTKGAGSGTIYSPSADTNATAANVCLLSSSTGQISGQITYVQQ